MEFFNKNLTLSKKKKSLSEKKIFVVVVTKTAALAGVCA